MSDYLDQLAELERDANAHPHQRLADVRSMEDFVYDETQDAYWDLTDSELKTARAVDGAVGLSNWPAQTDHEGRVRRIRPSTWINDAEQGTTVRGSTWFPGRPQIIEGMVFGAAGERPSRNARVFNTYAPPCAPKEKPTSAEPWLAHVRRLWRDPQDAEDFLDFCAHAVQFPGEKVNYGIVLSGKQGIGKDTALAPVREAVGQWNTAECSPDDVLSKYNWYMRSVLLVINEIRPHDSDHKASDFYNRMKELLAAPPDYVALELKFRNKTYIKNVCHTVLTTNDVLTMYIPDIDRRLLMLHSTLSMQDFPEDYFSTLWRQLNTGGNAAVAEWLRNRDLSAFNPNKRPRETMAKARVVEVNKEVRRTLLDDILEDFLRDTGNPEVFFVKDLYDYIEWRAFDDAKEMKQALGAKNVVRKMAARGYASVQDPESDHGRWLGKGFKSRRAYAPEDMPLEEALMKLTAELENRPLKFPQLQLVKN